MRRKDGKTKLRALRAKPVFDCGFRQNPNTAFFRHPRLNGTLTSNHSTVISLFSGCGGLDLGFLGGFEVFGKTFPRLPFDVIEAVDNLPDAVKGYRLNLGNHCREADLTQLPMTDLPAADILLGGFPCQDFSSSGPKTGFAGRRGQLYKVLVEYIRVHQPKIVVAENVTYLARLENGKYLQAILEEFEAQGYHFDVWELAGPDYGLPQSRKRIFLVGVRNDLPGFPVMPKPSHQNNHVSIATALCDLETIADETIPNQSQYFVASRATCGGGQGDQKNEANKVAYCIRANSRGRMQFHYALERRLTVRECARLQSFPDPFVFPFTTQRNLTLIGNAVPPILGYQVAKSIENFLYSCASGSLSSTDTLCTEFRVGAQMTRSHVMQPVLFECP